MNHFASITAEQWHRLDAIISGARVRHKNAEVNISYDPDVTGVARWCISLSNPYSNVGLGEVCGRFNGYGDNFETALSEAEKEFNDPQG